MIGHISFGDRMLKNVINFAPYLQLGMITLGLFVN
jgi:hypothetical protein